MKIELSKKEAVAIAAAFGYGKLPYPILKTLVEGRLTTYPLPGINVDFKDDFIVLEINPDMTVDILSVYRPIIEAVRSASIIGKTLEAKWASKVK